MTSLQFIRSFQMSFPSYIHCKFTRRIFTLWPDFVLLSSCLCQNKELKGRDHSEVEGKFYFKTLEGRSGPESRQTKAPNFQRRVCLSLPSQEALILIDRCHLVDSSIMHPFLLVCVSFPRRHTEKPMGVWGAEPQFYFNGMMMRCGLGGSQFCSIAPALGYGWAWSAQAGKSAPCKALVVLLLGSFSLNLIFPFLAVHVYLST